MRLGVLPRSWVLLSVRVRVFPCVAVVLVSATDVRTCCRVCRQRSARRTRRHRASTVMSTACEEFSFGRQVASRCSGGCARQLSAYRAGTVGGREMLLTAVQAPLCSGNGPQEVDWYFTVTAAAAAVTACGDEREGFIDVGQRLSCCRGQLDGDLMPGRISRVGGCSAAVDFGFEFGQLLQAEAALLAQCGSQCG